MSAKNGKAPAGVKQACNVRDSAMKKGKILDGSTVYLSGPMDFVASRSDEKKNGWRNRVGEFLEKYGVTVYDPWNKPLAKGLGDYGKEDEFSTSKRQNWTYEDSEEGDRTRAELCSQFWPTLHIDLRMTDTADFLVAYVPTNVYSVGTVHEIATARLQHKPVLFVSPQIEFPSYEKLKSHLANDTDGAKLLEQLKDEAPLRPNEAGTPSMWYMALIDAHYFFDGFGFAKYRKKFGWPETPLDVHEQRFPPKRPVLPYLEKMNRDGIPKRFDLEQGKYVDNPEWLIFKQ